MSEERSVLISLPDNNQRCLCFGHKTYCCKEDMDEIAEWHEVTFKFEISSYRLKKEFPEDIEESVLDKISTLEVWDLGGHQGHVIGVTKWRKICSMK